MIRIPGHAARPHELTNSSYSRRKVELPKGNLDARGTCGGSRFPSPSASVSVAPSLTSVALSKRIRETLERLAKAEEQAFAGEFLAPAIPGGVVQIRIAGVVCRLKIEPDDFEGWGVF